MNSKKYFCGQIYPSGCVVYTGQLPAFLPTNLVSCDANIDEIIGLYGDKIDKILEDSDLTDLNEQCLIFDPASITIKQLHQIEVDKICENTNAIAAIQLALGDIGNQSVEIDLDCLESDAAPCQQAPNIYSLLSILLLFKSEICALKEEVFGS